jgi:hypothetical protein
VATTAGMSRKMSFTLGFAAIVIATLGIGWLGKSMIDGSNPEALDFWHAGYYRDASLDRLFTVAFNPDVDKSEVRRYAKQLTYTPGQTTTAYFYPQDSRIPSGAITGAASMGDARQALRTLTGASPWRYAAQKDPGGTLRLVDCLAAPDDPLCRY